MSVYLNSFDLIAANISPTPDQIVSASALIDAFLARPEGLLYTTDSRGAPCYMTGANPTGSLKLTAPIVPGSDVTATVEGWVTQDLVGEVLIADRASQPAAPEALVVTAISGQTVTFGTVLAAHAEGAVLETGLVIYEERNLPRRRPIARVSRSPIVRLLAGSGRYGFGRRSDQFSGAFQPEMIACLAQFGSTPQFIPFDVTQASVNPGTDEIWIPAGLYLDNFTDVRLRYIAGYPTPPTPVKQACIRLIQAVSDFPELLTSIQTITAGATTIKKAAGSIMGDDVQAMLAPFQAHLFF